MNPIIKQWANATLSDMLNNVGGMGIVDTGKTFRRLRTKHSVRDNDIWKTAFRMPRYAIMVEKGAGSGWKNGRRIGPPTGRPPRVARPWFSRAMNKRFPELASKLSEAVATELGKRMDMQDIPYEKRGINNYRLNVNL